MKKLAVAFAFLIVSMAIFLPFSLVSAQGYSIQAVNQTIHVLYGGQVLVIENIQLSGTAPSTFELGLPYKYASSVQEGIAYDNNGNILPVTLGVQLRDQSGFYGANVNLPAGTAIFTIVFVLDNAVVAPATNGYNLDFPAYLGFTQTVSSYHTTVVLPSGTSIVGIDKLDGVVNASSYSKQNLAAFTYSPATASISAPLGHLQKTSFPSLSRQLTIDFSGAVTVKETYRLINNATSSVSNLLLNLPVGATNVVARDQFGRVLTSAVQERTSDVLLYNVSLSVAIGARELSIVTFDYSLPKASNQGKQYTLNVDKYASFNYFIEAASVTVIPPEGATITSPTFSTIGSSAELSRNAFQESLTINSQGVSYIDSTLPSEDKVTVTYDFDTLWIAFRPTSWMWAIVIVGVVIVAVWKRPRGKAATAPRIVVPTVTGKVALSPEHIKDFVESYEEKARVNQELRSLEARAQHGRIPRRRYKVQRKTLEIRSENISQKLANLRQIMRTAGGTYADIARQLEAAEVELNEIQLSLQNLEVRHEAGEISLEAYKKQLTDIERRREKAETSVDGLLLRLRGEIR